MFFYRNGPLLRLKRHGIDDTYACNHSQKTCHLHKQALYTKGAVAPALTETTAGKVVLTPP